MDVLGHYSFTLADTILAGEHRPLKQLETEFSEGLESLQAAQDINLGISCDVGLEYFLVPIRFQRPVLALAAGLRHIP